MRDAHRDGACDGNETLMGGLHPTLILHGNDDQIVPIADSALLSAKIVKNATLKVYPGLPHGMCETNPEQINADMLAFFRTDRKKVAG